MENKPRHEALGAAQGITQGARYKTQNAKYDVTWNKRSFFASYQYQRNGGNHHEKAVRDPFGCADAAGVRVLAEKVIENIYRG